jgi:hypothetical protein
MKFCNPGGQDSNPEYAVRAVIRDWISEIRIRPE